MFFAKKKVYKNKVGSNLYYLFPVSVVHFIVERTRNGVQTMKKLNFKRTKTVKFSINCILVRILAFFKEKNPLDFQ
jgi:prolipoprotein diacylglyceryltransferase